MFNGFVDLSIDKLDVRLERDRDTRAALSNPAIPIVTASGLFRAGRRWPRMLTHASAAKHPMWCTLTPLKCQRARHNRWDRIDIN
jgi:hypothetical protein